MVPCLASMPDNYHVHAFLGFYNNGSAVALSDGIGMAEPEGDGDLPINGITIHNWTNYATQCFYEMHTHDASGVIHVESTGPDCGGFTKNATPCNMSIFTLGDFLTEWGVQIMPTGIYSNGAPIMTGLVQIYTSGPVARGGPGSNSEVGSNHYSLYTGDPNAIPLYSHEVIFVDVGAGNLDRVVVAERRLLSSSGNAEHIGRGAGLLGTAPLHAPEGRQACLALRAVPAWASTG